MKPLNNNPILLPNAEPKVEIIHLPTVEVAQDRYDELIAKEERLHLLEAALCFSEGCKCDIEKIKKMFDIAEVKNV